MGRSSDEASLCQRPTLGPFPLGPIARFTRPGLFALGLLTLGPLWGTSTARAQCGVSSPGCDSGRPTGLLATFACACDTPGVCDIGEFCSGDPVGEACPDTGMHATCESRMWHLRNDNACIPTQSDGIDPETDCAPGFSSFSPTCPLTFTVLSRGTAQFRNVFGWYEVTGARPAVDDLHVMLDCHAVAGDSVVLDVRSDPAYGGGEVGFFLLTPEGHAASAGTAACASGDCCATLERYRAGEGFLYVTESGFSDDGSVTHLNIYDSTISDRKFYFAWEDTFGRSNHDFTDLVTSVEGVECSGAGEPCETGSVGACNAGITHCEAGVIACMPVVAAEPEVCNGVDDDCNGQTDDGASCGDRRVCDDGRCVPHCRFADEFVCAAGFECNADDGICVETACLGVTCTGAGQVCRDGRCAAECEGVICPHGQQCFRDRCIDPCASVTCGAGEVCRGGLCVPGCGRCDGVRCEGGLTCSTPGGECTDPSCPSGCAAGTFCRAGTCVDACDGAVCPRGALCTMGECVSPDGEDAGPSTGLDAGASTGMDAGRSMRSSPSSCGCRALRARAPEPALWLALSLLGLGLVRRRASR